MARTYVRAENAGPITFKAHGVAIGTSAADVVRFQNMPDKWRLTKATIYNASTNLSASTATVGVFTAAAGAGSTLVSPQTLTSMTTASVALDMPLANSTHATTSPDLYVRNVVGHPNAQTVSIALTIDDLSSG